MFYSFSKNFPFKVSVFNYYALEVSDCKILERDTSLNHQKQLAHHFECSLYKLQYSRLKYTGRALGSKPKGL